MLVSCISFDQPFKILKNKGLTKELKTKKWIHSQGSDQPELHIYIYRYATMSCMIALHDRDS